MRKIPLLNSKLVAYVDDEDYEEISQYRWRLHSNGRHAITYQNSYKGTFMHVMIMNTPGNMDTDHKDGNGLNNIRSNLRICTHSDNVRNRIQGRGASGYVGVTWHRQANKWMAQLMVDYKTVYLGLFKTPEEAALKRDEAAREYHGEFGVYNFPEIGERSQN